MIICPNCGASNKLGSTVCRMCAAPMPEVPQYAAPPPQGQPSAFPPTVIAGDRERREAGSAAPAPASPSEIECANCHTMNEAGWSFCQQCGSRLSQPAPAPMEPPQTFKTVPTEVPAADPGMQTVVADRPRTEPISPPPGPPPSLRTVAEPQPAMPADFRPDLATVVAPPPPVSEQKPAVPPAENSAEPPRTESVQPLASPAAATIACPKCNYANNSGSSFCANCGSVLTVARTIVMASPLAAAKGRLHLVMEGGQQGDVFDLSDETVVGRTNGDITFPHDGFMSGRHARIERRGTTFVLTDAGSRNGTFIKIKGEVELKPGDMILIGKQLFRFEE